MKIRMGLLFVCLLGFGLFVGHDANAQITPVGSYLTYPMGGEQLVLGNTYEIKWSPGSFSGKVNIMVYGRSGDNYAIGYIAKDVSNSGSYSWNTSTALIPEPTYGSQYAKLLTSNNYYIMVFDEEEEFAVINMMPFGISRPGVTLPSVTMTINGSTSPTNIDYNSVITIGWTAQNATNCKGTGDKFPLANGGYWNENSNNLGTSGTRQAYANDADHDYSYLIASIECFNSYGDSVTGQVDFTVNKPTDNPSTGQVTVISPNGGEIFKKGSVVNLNWSSSGYNGNVDLAIQSDATGYMYIARNVPNSGSYSWNTNAALIPSPRDGTSTLLPAQYYFYVSGSTTSFPYDTSNSKFTITDTGGQLVNRKPVARIDAVTSSGIIAGWAYDPDHIFTSIQTHTYFDTAANTLSTPQVNNTDFERTDVNAAFGLQGSHGFNIPIPTKYWDGQRHFAYVYAIDPDDATGSSHVLIKMISFTYKVDGIENHPIANYLDGALINDRGTIYIIEHGRKRAFTSMAVFRGLGYKLENVIKADLSQTEVGSHVNNTAVRHPRGTVIVHQGTVYFMGTDYRYPFTSQKAFFDWNLKFKDVVNANSADLNVAIGGALAGF